MWLITLPIHYVQNGWSLAVYFEVEQMFTLNFTQQEDTAGEKEGMGPERVQCATENVLRQEQKDVHSLHRKISDTLESGPLSLFPLNHWDLRALQNNWHSTSLTQPHI